MDPLMELCQQNIAKGSQLLLDDPWIQANSEVESYSCMGECSLCAARFFAFVEGEKITADSPEALLHEAKRALQAWQAEYQ